jgi:TonB family protein
MSREQNVPLLLWISTALLAHIATGGGAEQLARVFEDRADLHRFAESIVSRLHGDDGTFEVSFVEDVPKPEDPKDPEAPKPLDVPKVRSAEKLEKKPDAPKPEPPKKAEAEKPKPVIAPVVKQNTPPPPPPPPQIDHRIAVKQHADPNQQDNPNAHFIADEANHVDEESVARITSHDQDDPNPTPGGNHSGPTTDPGNSDHERVGESDEHPGDPTRAPGEASKQPTLERSQPKVAMNEARPTANRPEPKPSAPRSSPVPQAPKPPAPAPTGGAGPASPEVVAEQGSTGYHLDPARPGNQGQGPKPGPGSSKLPPPDPTPGSRLNMLGLGGRSATPNGVNLNLTEQGVVATVGEDKLTKEREADGERRKSAHRGSWQASSFERWKSAIENYVSSVKPGNQTALNTARVPFASYLNAIHNRIHPIFADDFLGSLDNLPANHPLSDPHLVTALEIVLNRDDGHVVKMGVVRTSGVTAFDIAALDAVQRASPFGKPPNAIVSPDGNVYFHWEFHRDPIYACSTMNARPFLLNVPAPAEPGPTKPGPSILPGGDPREQNSPSPPALPSREGMFWSPTLGHLDRKRS